MSVYTENGYKNRTDYLKCMSQEFGVPFGVVVLLAEMLGPSEDFDGLICELEDYEDGMYDC